MIPEQHRGETSHKEHEASNVSKHLVRSISQKGGGCKFGAATTDEFGEVVGVGGIGSWDEALNSCEIYDSSSNKWTEIQRLPVDFGVVCEGVFYVYSEADKLTAYDIGHGDGEIGRRNKAVRKLWELDLVYLIWNEVSVMEFLTMCDVSNPKMKWVHASKNQVAREMDVSSCMIKSMAVVHLYKEDGDQGYGKGNPGT
ncbi:hypothetical protein CTI12_AA580750 [Artemisia annua]|uniref:Galactose oxidase, beta-propeller n=1 Tax=Artemisia annua TaxID=35608 RepID=A0A2U1KP08_ARTAN|nr:hypothetical protein CTI12_AA580750 [Artemisia annua]